MPSSLTGILKTERYRNLRLGLLLMVGILLAYAPVWHAGFIWDDDDHLTKNPCIVGPLGFGHIWTSSAAVYYPLVLTSFWIQHALWGLTPLPYHLVNLALHVVSALLLWRVLSCLEIPGAWLGAALWSLDPVQAETAAWITEQKNTQSCLLYLLSILCFLKWMDSSNAPTTALGTRRLYFLSILCAALAILSKTSTVMLPVVLCLLWWWREGECRWRNLLSLAPYFMISLAAGLWTVWEQKYHSGAIGSAWELDPIQRLLLAARIPWFYLEKLLWPHPLIFIYPRWVIDPARWSQWVPLFALIAGLGLLWWKRSLGWTRSILVALLYFLISLFPVMGFFNVYFFRYSFVGDHFQYLAGMGPLALAGAAITVGVRRFVPRFRWILPLLTALILLTLGISTWKQCADYADAKALWTETLARNPACGLAHNNLGTIVLHEGRVEEAIGHFEKALATDPLDRFAECNLGWALRQQSRYAEAIPHFQRALGNDPLHLAADPGFEAGVHYDLGDTLLQLRRYREAIAHFERDIALNPEVDSAEEKIAEALMALGDASGAVAHLRHLLEAKPEDAATFHTLGKLLYGQGKRAEGIALLQRGLPHHPEASHLNDLAWMLSTAPEVKLRDGDSAVGLVQKVIEATGDRDPNTLDTLAAAYAETGDFPKALETAREALVLAEKAGNRELADSLRKEIRLYESGQPLREPAVSSPPSS
jgi:tetratricopeptide (TPR) repeat protein